MVAVVQLVRASDCGSECRRFESDQPPTKKRVTKRRSFFLLLIFIVTSRNNILSGIKY